MFSQRCDEQVVRESLEAFGDIPFNEPDAATPFLLDFLQSRVTSSSWLKSVRMGAESGFKVGFQNEPDDLRQQFVTPDGHIHSTLPLFANCLRNG